MEDGLLKLVTVVQGRLELYFETLNRLLSDIDSDEKLVIESIFGDTRGGKTFFMNSLLKVYNNKGSAQFVDGDTIGENFPFKNGADPHTTGIMAYPEVIHCVNSKGEKLAVILLDTQGTGDMRTDQEIHKLLVITSYISSTMIYNITKVFKKNNLDDLDGMIDDCKELKETFGVGSRLMILVRDSADKPGLNKELERLKKNYPALFEPICKAYIDVQSYNVRHPDDAVTRATGRISAAECGQEFLNELCDAAGELFKWLKPRDGITRHNLHKTLEDLVKDLNAAETLAHCEYRSAYRKKMAEIKAFKSLDQWIKENNRKDMLPKTFQEEMNKNNKQILEKFDQALYGDENEKNAAYSEFEKEFEKECQAKVDAYKQDFERREELRKARQAEERARQAAEQARQAANEAEQRARQAEAKKGSGAAEVLETIATAALVVGGAVAIVVNPIAAVDVVMGVAEKVIKKK